MKVIVLVGLPGSGKSTLAQEYQSKDFVVINQDTLGTRQKCLDVMESALIRRKNVVVDRTNISARQRKYFIDLAKIYNYDVECVTLEADPQICIERISKRANHPTISLDIGSDRISLIVQTFASNYERAELCEGFSTVVFKRV